MGKCCLHDNSFIFDQIVIKVAGNQDRHKSSDEFDFGPLVSMAHLYVFWNEIWPWHIGLRWAIVALWATCFCHYNWQRLKTCFCNIVSTYLWWLRPGVCELCSLSAIFMTRMHTNRGSKLRGTYQRLKYTWATSWVNVSLGIYDQARHKLTCSATETS